MSTTPPPAPRRALDDPLTLARAAQIMRRALARKVAAEKKSERAA